jgi:putative DNA primase/helicase
LQTDRETMLQALRQMPTALLSRPQWLLWRFVLKKGGKKPSKLPYYVNGHSRGWPAGRPRDGVPTPEQPNVEQGHELDRAALVSFEQAIKALESKRWDGLGFAFLPGDGLIGIDIDAAIDDDGQVAERCLSIIQACNSYTEYSPSGRGVHIFVQGETQTFKHDSIGLEVFCNAQFFAMTGRPWAGTPSDVRPIEPKVLARLQATVQAAKEAAAEKRAAETVAQPTRAASASRPVPMPPSGGDDFKRVNQAALAMLDAWVPVLFPAAKKTGRGYRVKSRDLGRDLQEDLSITSQGIRDFGVADMGDAQSGGRTPIDLVIEYRGETAKDALRWLAPLVGVALTPPARRAAAKPKAKPAAETRAEHPASGEEERAGPEEPTKAGGKDRSIAALRQALLKTGDGGTKSCRENVAICLQLHPELGDLVGFDEFAHKVVKLRVPPWGGPVGEWLPTDDYELGMFMARSPGFTVSSEAAIVAGVAIAAWRNRYHPVKDYLNGLAPWDGTQRLAYWLSECLGAKESAYTRLVGAWYVMGMVQRVLHPGCQMDYMIVLEGAQGKRKSTAMRTLVGRDEWFADTPIRIGDKDALLSLAGVWLYEMGELDSFNRAEVTAVKQYVSSRVDRVREPFARRHVDRPRSGVFGGTTNQNEYFKDPTGARRFWPVGCDGDIDTDKIAEWRDQLFAEALARLNSDDAEQRRYYPTRDETYKYLVPEQEQREIGDPWFERIATWVDSSNKWMDDYREVSEVENFTSHDILTRALGVPQDRIDGARQMATRVGIAMHKLGWSKHRDATGARLWRYWRPGHEPKTAAAQAPAAPPASGVVDEF